MVLLAVLIGERRCLMFCGVVLCFVLIDERKGSYNIFVCVVLILIVLDWRRVSCNFVCAVS